MDRASTTGPVCHLPVAKRLPSGLKVIASTLCQIEPGNHLLQHFGFGARIHSPQPHRLIDCVPGCQTHPGRARSRDSSVVMGTTGCITIWSIPQARASLIGRSPAICRRG